MGIKRTRQFPTKLYNVLRVIGSLWKDFALVVSGNVLGKAEGNPFSAGRCKIISNHNKIKATTKYLNIKINFFT